MGDREDHGEEADRAPQFSGGRFWREKLVTAPGGMKTQRPKIVAERMSANAPGMSTGRAEPMAMPVSTSASGTPDENRANTGRHRNGETKMQLPSIVQNKAMK